MNTISRSSRIPLYFQIEEDIKKAIENGSLKAGDTVPTEDKLCQEYNVSRITVRTAIQLLVDQGYLYKQQGKRTIVLGKQLKRDASELSGFSDDAFRNGKKPGSKTISLSYETPPSWVTSAMKLETTKKLPKLTRVRYTDNDPIAVQVCYLSPHLNISVKELEEIESLYKFLQTTKGIHVVQGEEFLHAAIVPKNMAPHLDLDECSAVLVVRRISYDETGMIVECVEGFYRSDRYTHYSLIKSDRMAGPIIN